MTKAVKKIQDTVINGVNVTRLGETIQNIQQDPSIADFKFRVRNQWQDGGYNKAVIKDFYGANQDIGHKRPFEIACDEPDILLGTDEGANPVEVLLAALSGCMTTSLAYYSASQGFHIEDIESSYEGDIDLRGFLGIDEKVEKGYREIRVNFRVKGDTPVEKIEEFVRRSPVFDTLTRPIRINIHVEKV